MPYRTTSPTILLSRLAALTACFLAPLLAQADEPATPPAPWVQLLVAADELGPQARAQFAQALVMTFPTNQDARWLAGQLAHLAARHPDERTRSAARRCLAACAIAWENRAVGPAANRPPVAPAPFAPAAPTPAAPAPAGSFPAPKAPPVPLVADPMPRPNYQWLHGARYTPTQRRMLADWAARHPEAPADLVSRQQQRDAEDEQQEREWVRRTFSGLGR
ncbi:MAG: hypothetical protein U0935_23620 [Pirellulales bacterium]